MAVNQGYEVIEPLNQAAERFDREGEKVIASQDWHTAAHSSFASSYPGKAVNDVALIPVPPPVPGRENHRADPHESFVPSAIQQVLWPDHCVQGSDGARFHDMLNLNYVDLVIRKGARKELDSYSVFFENDRHTPTGLHGYLRDLDIKQIFIGGLFTDYGVLHSAMDAVRLGYRVVVLSDAVCGMNIPEGSVERAFSLMEGADVSFITTREILV
jgi:nicotinamidase/pyrazinamidase